MIKSAFEVFQQELKTFSDTGVEPMLLELGKENLAHFTDSLYDGLPDIELSIKKAKEIMGEDFYGAERYLEVFGQELNLEEMGRVPFKVAELRKAKEFGMKLIGRYDIPDTLDGVAFGKLLDLGIEVPSSFDTGTLPRPVKSEWILISQPSIDRVFAYKQVQDSLKVASEILSGNVHPETKAEINQWYGKIHQDIRDGKTRDAEGLLNDLIANRASQGGRYLVSASEMIYDALMVSENDLKRFQHEVAGITGSLMKRGIITQFLELDFQGKELSATFVPVLQEVKGARYQIRV